MALNKNRVKVKVKVHTLDIAPLHSESPPQKRSGMTHVLKGFHSFTCTPEIGRKREFFPPLLYLTPHPAEGYCRNFVTPFGF